MKKIFLASLIGLAACAGHAQILWKVSGNDAKGTSYIFGTHHTAPISLLDSIASLKPALDGVDVVYGEIDMVSDPQAMAIAMQQMVIAPADSTLSKVMTPQQLDSLNAVLGKYSAGQLNASMLEPMKPTMVATQLSLMQSLTAFPGFNPAEQLDTSVQQLAQAAGKQIEGFETAQEQFDMLMGNPIAEQVEDLMVAVRTDSEAVEKAQKLANAYLNQNLDEVGAMLLDDDEMTEQALQRLIYDRNTVWAAQLAEVLPEKTIFVAVGCGHLPGDKGLIALLRNAGYTVEPVEK